MAARCFSIMIILATFCSCSTFTHKKSLRELYNSYWQYNLKRNPIGATLKGDKRYNDQLSLPSEKLYRQDLAFYRRLKNEALSVPLQKLSPQEKVNLNLFLSMLNDFIRGIELDSYYIQFSSRGGFHTWLSLLPEYTPFKELKDYDDYLKRLQQIPAYFDAHIKIAQTAIKKGYRYPRVPFQGFEKSIQMMISKSLQKNIFYKPFINMSSSLSAEEKSRLKSQARVIIKRDVNPSYRKFYRFWTQDIMPNMRQDVSVTAYPKGEAIYQQAVARHTSLALTPREIHQIGLSEVKRIKQEMTLLMKQVNFKGTLKEFILDLRTNPRFYPKTKQELLGKVRAYLRNMDDKLPQYFGRLPKSSYEIKEIPAFKAAKESTAYYMRPSPKNNRPGYYYVNTSQLNQRPLYEVEALSYHEAVPGHHLQIAIQQELTNIPRFRKDYGSTAFVEGWGLYSESLAKEMGFYRDPYSNFGHLTYEIWRACRLVVDTGLHAFNWSRSRAIQYMLDNTALSRKNIEVEVDRYITVPGQALAYKLGELKIKELKRKAEQTLGPKFDIKKFHDVVLEQGSVPLNLLEQQVDEWLLGESH